MAYARTALLAVAFFSAALWKDASLSSADAEQLQLKPMTIDGAFAGKKKKQAAVDLSGLSCLPGGAAGLRTCMAVNDENQSAQRLSLDADRLVVGAVVPILGAKPDPETLGAEPSVACGAGPGEFGELDGEAVSYSAPYFYIVGSHGCSRKADEFRLSSFVFARVKVDGSGAPTASVQTTYRVADALRSGGVANFGKSLEGAAGLNIEGMLVKDDRVWLGLRAPLDAKGSAILLELSAQELFREGHEAGAKIVKPSAVATQGRGIRDLAALPDGRIVVLGGAVNGPEVPFRLFLFNPDSEATTEIGELPPVKGVVKGKEKIGKAEAISVLWADEKEALAVVLFDGLENGAPHSVRFGLK
ncbi:DUF3616 domain-containing protein [Bradyrhizobium vignae]|uniref:DUF3616 domain-containing protein n=1 Tax=Bradyrhizobium vignae TaxID=1549949 RepID=A0A2U3PUM1_9BRAD|nr:DUF3616 domain-containing protein [Bradyrhizobium vignae]SPP92808.1 conserved exported protein of unknown function [Bradyrhizobium vignae]